MPRLRRRRTAPDVDAARLATQHLLLVPSTVDDAEVAALVRARHPSTDLVRDGEARLGRLSRLVGPLVLGVEEATAADVPQPWTLGYALEAPVEREPGSAAPIAPHVPLDAVSRAFPDGRPWREEARGLALLVDVARRVHGVVRVAGGGLLTPDPDRALDLLVHAPYWLEPDVLLGVVSAEVAGARLSAEGEEWLAPDAEGAAEDVLDAYAVVVECQPTTGADDGAVEVLVHEADEPVPAVAHEPWATRQPTVTYEVRWDPPDPAVLERDVLPPDVVASRERVRTLVHRLARLVVEATGGFVVDESGFPVDRYAL